MGKVGNIFRDTRLSKGLTLDQISDETNISKRFLQGIENDNFDGFPGEVYIIGFIQNYAEFLGLNTAEIVARFKAKELEPEPPAQETSLKKPSSETPEPIELNAKSSETQTSAETKPARKEPQEPLLFTEEPEKSEESEKVEIRTSTPSTEHAKSGKKPRASKKRADATHPSEPEKAFTPTSPASAIEPEAPIEKAQIPLPDSQKEKIESAHTPSFFAHKNKKLPAAPTELGHFLLYALAILIIVIGVVSILPLIKFPTRASRTPTTSRAEGLPYEQRMYPQDRVYLPLGNDFISVTLKSVKDKVILDTPYGEFSLGLNEEIVINPSSDKERLLVSITDFVPNQPQDGALAHFDVKEALSQQSSSSDITVPAVTATPASSKNEPAPIVLFKSASGPHPFYVNVSFVSPVMFRYEADKKEWVEKYYRKGESITVNASNSITFWTANAQAVKVSVFQSAGKSTELIMGGPGEISVQRLSWSNSQGTWALVAAPLD